MMGGILWHVLCFWLEAIALRLEAIAISKSKEELGKTCLLFTQFLSLTRMTASGCNLGPQLAEFQVSEPCGWHTARE